MPSKEVIDYAPYILHTCSDEKLCKGNHFTLKGNIGRVVIWYEIADMKVDFSDDSQF
jgi:hypothetical protein